MSKEMRIMRAIGDIDDNYIDEAAPVQKSRAIQLNTWTKYAGMAAAAVLVIGLGALAFNIVSEQIQTREVSPDVTGELVFSGNPYEDYDTLEEAESAVGFEIEAPDSIGKYSVREFSTISREILEVSYYDAENTQGAVIRKAERDKYDNISGNFNNYENGFNLDIDGRENVRIDGSGELFYQALWRTEEYSYSVSAGENGFTKDEMIEIIKNVK